MIQSAKITVVILLAVFATSYFILSSTAEYTGYQVKISDLIQKGNEYQDKLLMVPGELVGNSIKFDSKEIKLNFLITDGKYKLPVEYKNVKPDNFENGTEVYLEGFYDSKKKIFQAEKVSTKCPSKYEAENTGRNIQ